MQRMSWLSTYSFTVHAQRIDDVIARINHRVYATKLRFMKFSSAPVTGRCPMSYDGGTWSARRFVQDDDISRRIDAHRAFVT
jgi:hypothetical protein